MRRSQYLRPRQSLSIENATTLYFPGPMAVYDHELTPRISVLGFFPKPSKVLARDACVGRARVCPSCRWIFEYIGDRIVVEVRAPELGRCKIDPGAI